MIDAANICLIKVSYKSFLPVSACICCGSILPLFKVARYSFLFNSLIFWLKFCVYKCEPLII